MNKPIIFIFVLSLIVAYGCTSSENITFKEGIERINEIDEKYGATIKTPPNSTEKINGLLAQITGFAAANKDMPLSLKYLLDFKIKTLEAELLHIEGWQWGRGSTTDWGFGCRGGSARILNSSKIRNASAQKGYEALEALKSLIEEFPNEVKSIDLGQKDALFLNAEYYKTEEKARGDASLIRNLCKKQIKELNITI
jgi:hypothetical protein